MGTGTIAGKYMPEIISLMEVQMQCKFALHAFKDIEKGAEQFIKLKNTNEREEPFIGSPFIIHYNVHSFLDHAQIIGNFFFISDRKGSRRKIIEARCTRLKELAEIDDLQPLIKIRARHSLHHIDERIDEKYFYPKDSIPWDGNKISFEQINITSSNFPTKPDINYIRLFDADFLKVAIAKEEVELVKVKDAIDHIYDSINNKAFPNLSNDIGIPLHDLYRSLHILHN